MQVTHLYTREDGESCMQDMDLAFESSEPGAKSADIAVEGLLFRRFPPGHFSDFHNAPCRQLIVVVAGIFDIECASGTRRFKPGDVIYAADTTGRGHITRNIEGERIFAYLPVTAAFQPPLEG